PRGGFTMKALFLGVLAVAALGGTAHAQRFSNLNGGKLVEICTSRDAKLVQSCTAYIDGISDSVSFYQQLRPKDGSKGGPLPEYVCVQGSVTGVQLREAVVGWAQRHREQFNQSAVGVVLRALNETYLCEGEQR